MGAVIFTAVACAAGVGTFLVACCTIISKRGIYFRSLSANLKTLESKMASLEKLSERIRETQHTPLQERHNTFWFDGVKEWNDRARERKEEARVEIQNKCLRFFCPCSYEGLEIELSDLSKELEKWIKQGEDIDKEQLKMLSVVEKRPIFGLQSAVYQIQEYLGNSGIHIIGVSDSPHSNNLLKEIARKLTRNLNFLVISVNVGNLENKTRVQEAIIRNLRLSDDTWEIQCQDERSNLIRDFLGAKKFVLLLDGLSEQWEHSDLSRIGIPLEGSRGNKSKIIITAHVKIVFQKMKVDVQVEAGLFTKDDALTLSKSYPEAVPLDMATLVETGKKAALPLSRSLAEPLPVDIARLAALAEGPITIWVTSVNWVNPVHTGNDPLLKGNLVESLDTQRYLKHSPYLL